MGFDFSGSVLQGSRIPPVNRPTTGEPATGVIRDCRRIPAIYTRTLANGPEPVLLDTAADQYRTAVIEAPGTSPTEYLVWAQNTSNLALVDNPVWWSEDGEGVIPQGTLVVQDLTPLAPPPGVPLPATYGTFTDGTDHLIVTDDGDRSLGTILVLVIARGDVDDYDDDGWVAEDNPAAGRQGTKPYMVVLLTPVDQDADAGLVRLTRTTLTPVGSAQQVLTALGGGLSQQRADQIIIVRYTVASSKFWWTRNDRYETRFGWDGSLQRWAPYKGSAPKNLGQLLFDTVYLLNPKLKNLPINALLPGDSAVPDQYALIRVGTAPGAIFSVGVDNIRVKADVDVASAYDFGVDPTVNAVVGQTSGRLLFNPEFVKIHAGKMVWYVYKGFSATETGVLGLMADAFQTPLFLAPIPGPTDYPFIRFGSRRYLQPRLVDTEVALGAIVPNSGEVVVALSTGRLLFNQADLDRSDYQSPLFNKHFLGEVVVYDGVALNQVPQPTRGPVAVVNAAGNTAVMGTDINLYVPDSQYLPTDFVLGSPLTPYRGLGVSGILEAPDGTGAIPILGGTPGSVRPGGDDLLLITQNTGRVRQAQTGIGDLIVFSRKGACDTVTPVDRETDLPDYLFRVRRGQAYVTRQRLAGDPGSRIVIGSADIKRFQGDNLYFLQAELVPAVYTNVARLWSKSRDIFRFTGIQGDQILYYAIDGVAYAWDAFSLTVLNPTQAYFTAAEVAASIQADTVPALPGIRVTEVAGRIVISAGNIATGSVEIGFGAVSIVDLRGAAILGFIPGWRVVGGIPTWLPDSGVSLGLFRSPTNLDRSEATPDFAARDRVEGAVLQESIQPSPFVFMNPPPLQDIAGVDDGVFFNLVTQIIQGESIQTLIKPLQHYVDVIHRFEQKKFDWVERTTQADTIEKPTMTLGFGTAGVVAESMLGAPGIGGGLYLAQTGGAFQFQDPETDYILPERGTPGQALLIERLGERLIYGGSGTCVAGSGVFTDPFANFPATSGNRLKITSGDLVGSYDVVSGGGTTITVQPVFLLSTPQPVTWELYAGYTQAVYDPRVVADQIYKGFNHLLDEPFQVQILALVGVVPADAAAQTANRPVADMTEALASGRTITLRFGLVQEVTGTWATLTGLEQQNLGTLANDSLEVPTTDVLRWAGQNFSIRVGTQLLQHGAGLTGVNVFSPDPGGGNGIEYLLADVLVGGVLVPQGRLKFGTTVLSAMTASRVWYVEEFLDPAVLLAGQAEYNPRDGSLNLSAADMVAQAGQRLYFVEQMVTEQQQDVGLNPLLCAFAFHSPLTRGSVVEVRYWRADLEGRKIGAQIVEFLPVSIRGDVATQISANTYQFNTALDTVDQSIDPVIYSGATMQNIGGRVDCTVDYPPALGGAGRIKFYRDIPTYVKVTVNYAVYEARGGERAYEGSQKPAYRPPFYIKAAQDRFGLRGNRVAEFTPGQMIRLGEICHYIKSLTYYPSRMVEEIQKVGHQKVRVQVQKGDVTSVGIFPPTVIEEGTRSPGNDVITLITAAPITTVVDPDGSTPVVTTAPAGFMSVIDTSVFPFEPVNRGQKEIVFLGDLTQFAIPGHILEVGGCPFTVTQTTLSEDGTRSQISVASAFQSAFTMSTPPTVKLSYRPVYPPEAREFLGCGPVLQGESYELVLYGELDPSGQAQPGRTLIQGVEYDLNPDTGLVRLLDPGIDPLGPGQRLSLSFTRLRSIKPFWQDGVVVLPRVYMDFLHVTLPDGRNGLLGGLLTATYTFNSPDTFYWRALPLRSFLVEATQEAIQEITAKQPAGGAFKASTGGTNNWQQGRVGLLYERKHLLAKDRAARTFLDFYNTAIVSFEQILETISGGFVGDRDGKFRFWVGRGRDFAPPGYEDDVTGNLNPRFVWGDVFLAAFNVAQPGLSYQPVQADALVNPGSLTLTDGEVDGDILGSNWMDQAQSQQKQRVQNDVDDIVLIGPGRIWFTFQLTLPFFKMHMKGRYLRMGGLQRYSRLFPTTTHAFFRTFPGAGADIPAGDVGVYTWGRVIDGEDQKTSGRAIGQLANPVLGAIENVQEAALLRRRARGRIWGYFPNGIPAGAFLNGASVAIVGPCVVVLPALFSEVDINPVTGYPDETTLLGSGFGTGEEPSATGGDPTLAVPSFQPGDQVFWGQPDGKVYKGFTPELVNILGRSTYTGLFVRDVQYGCAIRFQTSAGAAINDPDLVLVGTTTASGTPAHLFPIEQGDTLFAVAPILIASGTIDPTVAMTPQQLATLTAGSDIYRSGFDVKIVGDGRVVDTTLPSFQDPSFFGLREMFGQNPPDPMGSVEGSVEFLYTSQSPLLVPALEGKYQDDSGDYQIPYMKISNTELDRFAQVSEEIAEVMAAESPAGAGPPFPTSAVYPDEVLAIDGSVVPAINPALGFLGSEPATLLTLQDMAPNTPPARGVTDLRRYDLLFVETSTGAGPFSTGGGPTPGPQGIWSVGDVSVVVQGSRLEPPRFVTRTLQSSPIRYVAENALAYTMGQYPAQPQLVVPPPPGVRVYEDLALGRTVLDFTSVGQIALNDGTGVGVGNFNDIWSLVPPRSNNIITIRLYARRDVDIVNGPLGPNPLPSAGAGGELALTIQIQGATVTVTDYQGFVLVSPPVPAIVYGTSEAPPDPVWVNNREIIISQTGFMPWGFGPPNQWFLPHALVLPWRREMLYGFEFTVSIDTDVAATGESVTAWVDEDRLTFHEDIDFRLAKRRGYVHPQSGIPFQTQLTIENITVGYTVGLSTWSDVLRYSNGLFGGFPIPFTFLARSTAPDADSPGIWAGLPGEGSLKVMAFEGHGNIPITGVQAHLSAAPSNERNEAGTICSGWGFTASKFELGAPGNEIVDDRVLQPTVGAGAVANVQHGDVLVISQGRNAAHPSTAKAGSYLVRHAVERTNIGASDHYRATAPNCYAGQDTGWAPFAFPKVVVYDPATWTLTITNFEVPNGFVHPGGTSGFGLPPGRVFILCDLTTLNDPVLATAQQSVIGAIYTAFTVVGTTAVLTLNPLAMFDAVGPIVAGVFAGLIQPGMQVSGMTRFPVNVSGEILGLPRNNCVAYDEALDNSVRGFRWLTFRGPTESVVHPAPGYVELSGAPGGGIQIVPAPGVVVPAYQPRQSNHQFILDELQPVYDRVVRSLDLYLTAAQWRVLNIPFGSALDGAGGSFVCLLPNTRFQLADNTGVVGHYAQAGVFLEPSVPRAALNLTEAYARVVDGNPAGGPDHSLPDPSPPMNDEDREIGMRELFRYTGLAVPEEVEFAIRRIRRFHDANTEASQNLIPLRFAYEIRRGRVSAYSTSRQKGLVTAANFTMNWEATKPAGTRAKAQDVWNDLTGPHNGTNLRPFDNADVNINPGDLFRLLDKEGQVVDEVEIESIQAGDQIRLAVPGLQATPDAGTYVGMRFEVWLRQAPVPHEQSNEQLLNLITDREVFRTDADWDPASPDYQKGGWVRDIIGGGAYSAAVNRLRDDLNAAGGVGGFTFGARGVQKGDIVLVDPLGWVPLDGLLPAPPEQGLRQFGDDGVAIRAPLFVAGGPSALDDNRGFYRVLKVDDTDALSPALVVNPETTFTGGAANVVFDPADPLRAYAVYPTVTASGLSGGIEGQMDLRPTRLRDPVTESFVQYQDLLTNYHSIRPFSYRVIRPSGLFSDEAIDLVLSTRERMLTLIEKLKGVMLGRKGGRYYIFQKDRHIHSLGIPTNPEVGWGLFTNALVENLLGHVETAPFLNCSDTISLLDRRVWILDTRLDSLMPDPGPPPDPLRMVRLVPPALAYTAYTDLVAGVLIRPVLPDRVNEVLDVSDLFRPVRYTWLNYRVHLTLGTLAGIERFDRELPERLAEQKRLLLLRETASRT